MGLSASAQDDEVVYAEGVQPAQAVKKPAAPPKPKYPMTEVKGVVLDAASKAPLAGVQVQTLNDIHYTAMTDAQGRFTISVPTFAAALYVHTPQYMDQQVGIGRAGEELTIRMVSDKFRPMYGKAVEVTASPAADIASTTSTSTTVETDIASALGEQVRTISRSGGPGYGAAMFVRGLNSLNANAQPLVVVDGVVRDMQYTRSTLHYGDYTNILLNINPEDVQSVKVLKNATAIYGAKGANGVILITTKRGKSMATRIDANVGVGYTMLPKLPSMLDAAQYRTYATELLGSHPDYDGQELRFINTDPGKFYYSMYNNSVNWQDEVYRTALTQDYSINVQGGDNIGMYNLSLGYTDGQSTAKNNGFNRLNVRFNTDINVIRNLVTRFDMSFTKINRDVFDNGAPADFVSSPLTSPTLLGLVKAPFLNPYVYNNVTRKLSSTMAEADDYLSAVDPDLSLGNPTALLYNGSAINKNRVETTQFNAVIAPRYQFTPELSLSETFSYTLDRISQRYYRPVGGMPIFHIDGMGDVQSMAMSLFSKETSVESDTRLQFTKQFAAHFLDVYGGFRYNTFTFDDSTPQGQYQSAGNDKMPNISTNMDYRKATGTDDAWRSMTWYANADYNYRNRYFAQLAVAVESSSRFGANAPGLSLAGVKWGVFPSVQLGWAVSNEAWFPKTRVLNHLLVKAGYDISGNDDISNYAARTSFGVMKYLDNATAAQLNNIGNDKIQWEQTGKLNVGIKTAWADNRIGLDFDYYRHHTTNLLTLKTFENPVAGINNYWSNGGTLDNTGFEATLTGKPVIGKNWNMEMGVSAGHYKNEIKALPNNTTLYVDGQKTAQGFTSSLYGTDNVATIVGQAVGVFYGYKALGVMASDKEAAAAGNGGYLYTVDATGAKQYFRAGDMRFADINGDGEISQADKTIIGDPNPDFYGNMFANLTWKNLTLGVALNYSIGNDVFNYQRSILEGGDRFFNQTTAMANRWRYEGHAADLPRATFGDPMGNSRFSDRWIEDGSYLRLKSVNLTYKFPVSSAWLQGLAIWAQADNLFTLTKYLGGDPEFSVANGVLYQGIDAGNMALSRTFTVGLKINL